MARSYRKYDEDFKRGAVQLVVELGFRSSCGGKAARFRGLTCVNARGTGDTACH